MPYIRKGKCVYKKDTGKKVGCSKSVDKAKRYIKALHANVEDEEQLSDNFTKFYNNIIKQVADK